LDAFQMIKPHDHMALFAFHVLVFERNYFEV
jgi:hypothetical protein